jgi:ferritin-like metal-binding protein YciE
MYTEMKQTIIQSIKVSNEKATTINRVFGRLTGSHKANIKAAMKELIREGNIKMIVATGDAADYLNVQSGTEVYILTN